MLRVLLLLLVAFAAMPAMAAGYHSEELAAAAATYRQDELGIIKHKDPARALELRRAGEDQYAAKAYDNAADTLGAAVADGLDDGPTWLALAKAEFAAGRDQARASAYNAYLESSDPAVRAAALVLIGRDYDRHDRLKEALAAFEGSLAFAASPAVAERVAQLHRLTAFRVTKITVEAEADVPSACLRFDEAIGTAADISYGAFVRTDPAFAGIVTARGDTLCIDGLKHGQTYAVQILGGLPAANGDKLHDTLETRIVVPDRQPSVSFAGTGYVLPQEDSAGLPLTTINVDDVKLKVLRVNTRNLVPTLDAGKLTMTFFPDDVDEVMNRSGSLVWHGEMAISGTRNRAVRTAIPLKSILRDKGPGVYLVAAERAGATADQDGGPATNWVLASDLGLVAYSGRDGLAVDVRSLATAKPMAGVEIRLFARDNGELGRATSDADGIARFPGGLLRGRGGDEPFAVMAYGPDKDFNFLEIGRAAFDLSDRGVAGRAQPGPVDAFLYTDRGIYRPGESVHLTALVRDDKADAIKGLPVSLRLLRPDGIEVERHYLTGDRLGAHQEDFNLPADARMGEWRAELLLDPKAPPIGSVEFQVEDFVPPQLKVELSAADAPITAGKAFPVGVSAQFYYGAPGADLTVQADATIAFDDNPYPGEPGYSFGLVDEDFAGERHDIDVPKTDASGKSTVSVVLAAPPKVTRPLAATIRVKAFEPSGRAVTAKLVRPIAQRPLAIGLRSPSGDEAVPDGQAARLDVIAVDPQGKRIAAQGLRWELLRETWDYQWYSLNGEWRYRSQVRSEPIDTGTINLGTAAPAVLSRNLPSGRYRWEVTDGATGAQSSLRFEVGWWLSAELPDVPDKLQAVLDKKSYRPGDTARLFIKAPFAGEAELAIASDRILALRNVALPAGGTTIDIPVDNSWGGGVYTLVSAYRPASPSPDSASTPGAPPGALVPPQLGPGRAVGVAWLGIDESPRTLSVSIAAPDVVRPRAPVEIPLKVSGLAPGEEAYVTLAAVDEAVLKLTDFASPAPQTYYYGQRRLGVELRDLYGRLIDPRASGVGVLRSGGDEFAKRSVAGLPQKSSRVVALFSGIVRLAADGTAKIRFAIPDFEGQLRLMAVAFSAHEVGSGSAAMTVRDPVVTTVSLPRFLAPGDSARIAVGIDNLEGPAGDYRLALAASGVGHFAPPVDQTIHLDAKGRFGGGFTLSATTVGKIALSLRLTGPNKLTIARDFTIGVRPAQAYQLQRFIGELPPGQSVTLDDGAAGAFLPDTAEALLTVSPRPDWDVPGLLRALDRYPYGCLEQTTSRALPLLYADAAAQLWRTEPGFSPAAAIDGAIGHIVELQRADGSFGVWSDSDDTVPWLDAYASDFLLRAKELGKNVPDYALTAALNWLRDYTRQDHTGTDELPAVAYAHYVLARGKMDDLGTLRYFNDTEMAALPTQLAKAQLGAALALYGDAPRAAAAYAAALGTPPRRPPGLRYVDYGSDLRDSAGALSFAASDPALQPRLTAVMDRIAGLFAHADATSTQEQAWLLMAAVAAGRVSGGTMTVAAGNNAPVTRTQPLYWRRRIGAGAPPLTIANRGDKPVWRTVSITGVPRAALPAEAKGYTVSRMLYRPDGSPADLSRVRQTDTLIVVIKGKRSDASLPAQSLIVDLLPAGFEIETATASKGETASSYPWLPKLTDATYTEERDDRYIAALDLTQGMTDFTLAYVVRAVTPGDFAYPALVAEDMYEPQIAGRTALGHLTVQAP